MSTLNLVTLAGIALVLVLGLIVIIGGFVWFWRRRRDEEEDTTDPEADGDTDGDGDPTPEKLDDEIYFDTINRLDKTVYHGVKAMLERADDELMKRLRRETITPLLRQLRRTRLALLVVTVILAGAMAALWGTRPTNVDLYLHGSTTNESGETMTLDQRLHVIEAWQTENTVTSPLVHDGVIPPQRSFTSLQDLLTQLSGESYSSHARYKALADSIDFTYETITAMVPHLDCYTERLDNTPDDQGCYELTCTIFESTFTRLHRYDWGTSAWVPCE